MLLGSASLEVNDREPALGNRLHLLKPSPATPHIPHTPPTRSETIQDILLGSAALKVNAWEPALEARLHRLRAIEHRDIAASLRILTTIEAAIFFAPGVATFMSLLFRRYGAAMEGGDMGLNEVSPSLS
jgi:hypothetical protein